MPQRAFPRRGCGDAGKRICRRVGPFARARRTLPSACRPPGTRASLRAIFARARRTLPSACRPFGPCAFLHAIFARARRALSPACHPPGRASLHAIFARAPDAPSACRPSGPRAFLHAIFARAPDAPICLPSARPARLPARNFRPCAGRSHLLAARSARAPSCTQFSPVRRTLPSACRPPGPRASPHAIFARAPDAFRARPVRAARKRRRPRAQGAAPGERRVAWRKDWKPG